MALQKEHTAFGRIVQFDDNKTEQVWDVFRDEFGRASVAEDGVTGWKIAEGKMQIEEIDKKMSETETAKIISDIALSTSSNIQIASSWISNKRASRRDCALASLDAVITSYVLTTTSATEGSPSSSSIARPTVASMGGGNSPVASDHACFTLLDGARDSTARMPCK